MKRTSRPPKPQSTFRIPAYQGIIVTFYSAFITGVLLLGSGCASNPVQNAAATAPINSRNPEDFFVVDCLLPGQVRQIGQSFSYIAPRRAVKTTAFDCGLRGGEFVAYNRASYQTALNVWLPLAEQGDPEAQTYVGEIYDKGLGVAPDYPKAAAWYRKAADQGSSRAAINLGYLYEKGLGVDQDVATALNYYRSASGLTGDDLTFESTVEVETQERMGAARKQIEALQQDFENSRSESEALRKKLAQYESQLRKERNRLNQALDELEKARRKTKALESQPSGSPQSNRGLEEQRQQLEKAQAEVLQERARVKSLEQKFQNETSTLTSKLESAESKAAAYEQQIEQSRNVEATAADLEVQQASEEKKRRDEEMRALEAKLAKQENQLRAQLNKTLDELDTAHKKLASVQSKPAGSNPELEIRQYQEDLDKKQSEVLQQRALLTEMENRNKEEKGLLTARLSEAEQRSESYERSLNKNIQEREQLDERLAKTDTELKDLKQRLEKTQSELKKQSTAANNEEVKKLQRDLTEEQAQTTRLLNEKNQELEALKAKIRDHEENKTATGAASAPKADTLPKIVLLDPALTDVKTRGRNALAVKLRAAVPTRGIVGRAEAAAGILSFLINDQAPESLDDSGLFKTTIRLAKPETPVNITLIDKNGSRATLDFIMIPGAAPKSKDEPPDQPQENLRELASNINFGSYHALLIGNEKYANLPTLDTPIDDVREIDGILRKKYKFKTTVLANANRYDILSALNKLRGELTEETNLLIYYAGHGEIDKVNQRGQWLPVDAETDNNANWISTSAITDIINTMSVQHIMIVADSCYSGAMTRTSLARLDAGMSVQKKLEWLQTMVLAKSRTVLTSGGIKPVLDSGAEGHSIFAKAFINALNRNSDILEGQALYRQISGTVKKSAKRVGFEQSPQYGPIRHTGHEAGEFFFVPFA
ncbi:MAG: caspase family protein [Methylococcaceae bacterium]|nr:caspase family protein [Methylococcaceae bacterium]